MTDIVERLRYHAGNPSAWDNYDESASELIREAALALESRLTVDAETSTRTISQRIEDLAHRWAHAAYCKALGRTFEDFDPIKAEIRSVIADTITAQVTEIERLKALLDKAVEALEPLIEQDRCVVNIGTENQYFEDGFFGATIRSTLTAIKEARHAR